MESGLQDTSPRPSTASAEQTLREGPGPDGIAPLKSLLDWNDVCDGPLLKDLYRQSSILHTGRALDATDEEVLEKTETSGVPPVTGQAVSPGKKFDGDKAPVVRGNFHYFPLAHLAVAMVSKHGAEKYDVSFEEKNWEKVDDGLGRYTDADGRHLLGDGVDGLYDPDSDLLHAAHHAWDALARLQLMLADGIPLENPE